MEYNDFTGICHGSLNKTHIKWSNLYPWKLARELHYQRRIDIRQHDGDQLAPI